MKREKYIDLVKGFSIWCIVLLHYVKNVFPNEFNVFVGSFMITAFYVTSGWVAAMSQSSRHTTIKEFIKKRWKQLGMPYVWWTVIILVFDIILLCFRYYDFRYIEIELYKAITLRGIGTLWFLPALFGGEIIWYGLKKQNKIWLILIALVLTICYQYFYTQFLGDRTELIYRIIDAPFRTISNILGAWVGIAFGYISYVILHRNVLKSSNITMMTLGIILCVLAFISANYLPAILSPFWSLFAPLLGPLGLLLVAKSVQQIEGLNFYDYWGRNSLNLMVTHYSITLVLFSIVIEQEFGIPFDGWITLLCFGLSIPIQYLFVFVIGKYARVTLGK